MKPTTELFLTQAERLVAQIKPQFEGQPPVVLGVVLAELVAEFFAGMRPDRRPEALDDFRRTVDDMIPVAEKLMFHDGLPAEWRR
jgi:hypothetical protein